MPSHHSLLIISSSLSSFDNNSSNNANSQTNGAMVSGTMARGRRLLKVREKKEKKRIRSSSQFVQPGPSYTHATSTVLKINSTLLMLT